MGVVRTSGRFRPPEMMPVLHEAPKGHLVLVGVMSTHQRHPAGGVDRRTLIPCRSATIIASAVLLLAACGSAQPEDSAGTTPPVSQNADRVDLETVDPPQPVGTQGNDESVPDYTDAELEVLLDGSSTVEYDDEPPEPEPLEADSPAAAIEIIEAELDESSDATAAAAPILDRVQPLDDAPTGAVFGIRDGRHINEAGEAIRLDEAAALACANVEIGLTALDEGRTAEAADHLRAASVMAADADVSAVNRWSPTLEETAAEMTTANTSDDAASALLAFLTTCTEGGYEL